MLSKVEGYTVNKEIKVQNISLHILLILFPGQCALFFTLSEEEQFNMFDKYIFPEILFLIYTSHNFLAVEDNLGYRIKVDAKSETGVVEEFSFGLNQEFNFI
ncbi:MAG: hypothetical protein AB8U25_06000 [Rickettsiales endosymbiont of Dermacentor nuttalli]